MAPVGKWQNELRERHPEAVVAYLESLTNQVVSVFGEQITGIWLLGSAAYGGFGDGSDLDVQAATEHTPRPDEIEHLVELLTGGLASCPAQGLEFVLYDRSVLEAAAPPLQWSLNLNGGPARTLTVSTNPASESWHWFVLDLAIGRDSAVTLHGAELKQVVGPIDRDLQLRALERSMRWHEVHEPSGPNHVANAARGLRYLETGTWGSKPSALAWLAQTGRDESAAVDEIRRHLGGAEEPSPR